MSVPLGVPAGGGTSEASRDPPWEGAAECHHATALVPCVPNAQELPLQKRRCYSFAGVLLLICFAPCLHITLVINGQNVKQFCSIQFDFDIQCIWQHCLKTLHRTSCLNLLEQIQGLVAGPKQPWATPVSVKSARGWFWDTFVLFSVTTEVLEELQR